MAINISTTSGLVTLKELYEGYGKGVDPSRGPWVRKRYLCPWGFTNEVCNALAGYPLFTGVGNPVSYVYPHRCPESPDLYCLNAEVLPGAPYDARDGGRPRFNLGVIEADYGVPQYDIRPDDDASQAANSFVNDDQPGTPYVYAMQSIDFDSEVIKLPGSAYKFVGLDANGVRLPCDVPVSISIGVADMVFVRKNVPYLPFQQWNGLMNKLNKTTFLGQPKGQVKFRKWRTRRELVSNSTRTQEIELHFKWREYDHNKVHRPDRREFDFVEDSGNRTIYDYADLSPILK